jgi:nucleotide-binding universal stress UspA family protein
VNILVGIDGGDSQRDALALGARLAGLGGKRLLVATVHPTWRWANVFDPVYEHAVEEEAAAILRRARCELGRTGCETRALGAASVPPALHELAAEEHVDALVIGSCHRGAVGRVMLGGTAERVVQGAPCPVVVAPRGYATHGRALRSIAVAYDGGAESDAALGWAQTLAERGGARLTLVHVFHAYAGRRGRREPRRVALRQTVPRRVKAGEARQRDVRDRDRRGDEPGADDDAPAIEPGLRHAAGDGAGHRVPQPRAARRE